MSQEQLGFFESNATDANVKWLEDLLLGVGEWMLAAEISQSSAGRLDDRRIRQFASASLYIVSGQRGYRHVRHATIDEISACSNTLESQARKMLERAIALRRHAHQTIG